MRGGIGTIIQRQDAVPQKWKPPSLLPPIPTPSQYPHTLQNWFFQMQKAKQNKQKPPDIDCEHVRYDE